MEKFYVVEEKKFFRLNYSHNLEQGTFEREKNRIITKA